MIGTSGTVVVGVYLLSLLAIGACARLARRESSLRDYYLAGGSLGLTSLFFTFYATQYSGNTLFAIPGEAYREGFAALAVTIALMGIIGVYATFAPALHRLAAEHRFVSPGDFVLWRYRSPGLVTALNLIFAATLTGYILANLKAVGLLVESASGGAVSYAAGVVVLSLVMAIYESLGGMRSVVWTDVLQGSILLVGCVLVFVLVGQHPDMGLIGATELTAQARQVFGRAESGFGFVSLALLIAIGASVYPQAIQRIYAARDAATLKRSFALMLLMPLVVTLPLSLVAMSAGAWLPALPGNESERVILHSVVHALSNVPVGSAIVALFLGAAIAAVMSTVDSALLALGAIISNDVIGRNRPANDQHRLHAISRGLSWILMAVMASLAIVLPQSIWTLMVLKFELLVQVAPTIILGARWRGLSPRSLLAGLIAGCALALLLKLLPGSDSPLGIHAGMWGLAANLAVMLSFEGIIGPQRRH